MDIEAIRALRHQHLSYRAIAEQLGVKNGYLVYMCSKYNIICTCKTCQPMRTTTKQVFDSNARALGLPYHDAPPYDKLKAAMQNPRVTYHVGDGVVSYQIVRDTYTLCHTVHDGGTETFTID